MFGNTVNNHVTNALTGVAGVLGVKFGADALLYQAAKNSVIGPTQLALHALSANILPIGLGAVGMLTGLGLMATAGRMAFSPNHSA